MWNARPVVRLKLNGEFVKRYDSAGEAKMDGFHGSDVLLTCKGVNKSCKGYMFMFEDEYIEHGAKNYIPPEPQKTTPVIQCDLDGNFIKEFSSVNQASKETGTCRTTISGAITGNYKSANGFIFVYKEDFPIKDISKYRHNKKGKRIAQINPKTNEIIKVFDRIADAGRELGVNYKAIHKVVDLPGRTAYGYKWISQ